MLALMARMHETDRRMSTESKVLRNERFRVHEMDGEIHRRSFAQDVTIGLTAPQKWLPPKYFYDDRGSQLYEQICALPEYYLYRAELDILSTFACEIHAEIGELALVELGSGSAAKTRHLLNAYERAGREFHYCPVDISRGLILDTANRLLDEYTHIKIQAIHADFAQQPEVIQALELETKAIAFLGSTLGNFTPAESLQFLQRIAAILGPDDLLLLGIDLKKSPAVILPAYDDAQGVTAAFNMNMLHRINSELGGRFSPRNFQHIALYDAERGCIEMRLRSLIAQQVPIAKIGRTISFSKEETIHTESSYKYSANEIRDLAYQANFILRRVWFDAEQRFLVALFRLG
jgi:L-histidine N-alpha-methyltransferase